MVSEEIPYVQQGIQALPTTLAFDGARCKSSYTCFISTVTVLHLKMVLTSMAKFILKMHVVHWAPFVGEYLQHLLNICIT